MPVRSPSTTARATLLAALLALLLVAAPLAHARRTVPHGFYGVMWDHGVTFAPAEAQDAQWDLMAESGVESVRTVFNWAAAQPHRGGPFDFSYTDGIVRRAALRRIHVLPVVNYTPTWARAYRNRLTSPPRREADYAVYVRALVDRYGPSGSFWGENPDVPVRPLREWQIWNEPHLRTYWDAPERGRYGSPQHYGRLLRASYRAIKLRDRRAKVVMAGVTQRAWDELELLYARGRIKGYFDVAALQTFPQTARRAVKVTRFFRDAMRRRGDGRKPIYITEITWPASKGRTQGIRYQRQETARGMAGKLIQGYRRLTAERRRLRLARVYWYTWSSPYGRGGSIFDYAGLLRYASDRFTAQPALGAFQRSARRDQGCAKSKTGRCL